MRVVAPPLVRVVLPPLLVVLLLILFEDVLDAVPAADAEEAVAGSTMNTLR